MQKKLTQFVLWTVNKLLLPESSTYQYEVVS